MSECNTPKCDVSPDKSMLSCVVQHSFYTFDGICNNVCVCGKCWLYAAQNNVQTIYSTICFHIQYVRLYVFASYQFADWLFRLSTTAKFAPHPDNSGNIHIHIHTHRTLRESFIYKREKNEDKRGLSFSRRKGERPQTEKRERV